jgi:hypothetical protein
MQAVDILGDDSAHAALLDQLGQRAMVGMGSAVSMVSSVANLRRHDSSAFRRRP